MYDLKPGKVYISLPRSTNIFTNPVIVDDFALNIELDEITKLNYILKYTTGKNTLAIFKNLMVHKNYETIVIFVENFECFYRDFLIFKDLDFSFLEHEDKTYEDYKERYIKLRKHLKVPGERSVAKKLQNELQQLFEPDITSSFISSLESPTLYLYEKYCPSSMLYLKIKEGPISYSELKLLGIGNFEKHLKSLIFTEVIVRKDNIYKLNIKLF